jgi:hypothetical protein
MLMRGGSLMFVLLLEMKIPKTNVPISSLRAKRMHPSCNRCSIQERRLRFFPKCACAYDDPALLSWTEQRLEAADEGRIY